mgnify:CR=1 FL=1
MLVVIVFLFPAVTFATPPLYNDGTATQEKIAYCEMLVSRYGHLSKKYNHDYYGQGVQAPTPGEWSIRIREPGWFSDSLYISFEQITTEPIEDFKHSVYCHWSKDAPWFEFVIRRFDNRTITVVSMAM